MPESLSSDERSRLVLHHLDSVHAAASRFSVPPWVRDELVSAGYEALVRASSRFEPSFNTAFKSFAYRPVLGSMFEILGDHRKWSSRHTQMDPVEGGDSGDHPSYFPDFERRSLTSEVLAAIDRLPAAEAELIKAHFLRGQTLSSAGASLGLSKTRIGVRVARAMRLLGECLNDNHASWPTPAPRPKRRFSEQYKAVVLGRALEPSANVSQLSRDFDVPPTNIRDWIKRARSAGATPARSREMGRSASM